MFKFLNSRPKSLEIWVHGFLNVVPCFSNWIPCFPNRVPGFPKGGQLFLFCEMEPSDKDTFGTPWISGHFQAEIQHSEVMES